MADIINNVTNVVNNGVNNTVNTVQNGWNAVTGEVDSIKSGIDKAMNRIFGGGTNLVDYMIDKPIVLAEKILKRSAQSGALTIPVPTWTAESMTWKTVTVPFFLDGEFSMSLSNKFEQLLDMNSMVGAFVQAINYTNVASGQAQVTMQSEAMSSLCWHGSSFGGFNIQCVFIATRRTINPVEIINILAKSCLPAKLKDYEAEGGAVPAGVQLFQDGFKGLINGGAKLIGNMLKDHKAAVDNMAETLTNNLSDVGMVAPLGYGVQFDNDSANNGGNSVTPLKGTTLSLHIGDWFMAPELVVDEISNIQFSKEMIAPPSYTGKNKNDLYDPKPVGDGYGYPLYAKCTIRLRPYTLVDLKRFESYFIKNGRTTNLLDTALDAASSALQLPS